MTVHSLIFSSPSDGTLLAPGHCGLIVVPDFLRRVQSWCHENPSTALTVDLSQVETLEAGAFRALVWARRYCLSHGVTLSVLPPGDGVLGPQFAAILHDLFGTGPAEHGETHASHAVTTSPSVPLAG